MTMKEVEVTAEEEEETTATQQPTIGLEGLEVKAEWRWSWR